MPWPVPETLPEGDLYEKSTRHHCSCCVRGLDRAAAAAGPALQPAAGYGVSFRLQNRPGGPERMERGGGFLRLAGNSGRVSDCRSGIHRPDDSVPVEFLPVAGLGLGPRVHRLLSLYLRMGAELLQPPHSRKHEAGDRRLHGGRSARRHGVLPSTGGPAGRANEPGRKRRFDSGGFGCAEPVVRNRF